MGRLPPLQRWNLSPLDERWEAIEECERLFSTTRTRVSMDNIGLARVHDGLELVRIGSPMRPEMAAWRYGDQLGRRRRKHLIWTGAAIASAVRHHRVRARVYPPNSSEIVRVRLDQAVRMIEEAPDTGSLFKRYPKAALPIRPWYLGEVSDENGRLVAMLPKEFRLALEMATHEESERRALEGELAVLEAAWKNAEEIAAIADDMFVSDETRARLAAFKGEG